MADKKKGGATPGQVQKNPHNKPKVDTPTAPVLAVPVPVPTLPETSVEPLFHTYDQPKPEGAYFDGQAADDAVAFIEGLHHFQGVFAGHPLLLLPWQSRFVRELFGWKRADGSRLYRTAYLEVPRKAGKSTLASAIGLYLAYGDAEAGPQVYFAAADKDQAKVCYKAARVMAELTPSLASATVFYNSTSEMHLVHNPGGIIKALSSDAAKQYGLNIHGLVFDELMTQKSREMWDALTTSQGARRQPLVIAISTAGWNRNSICYEQHEYARKIAAGEENDPTYLGVVYSVDETTDWREEEAWVQANPSLGYTVPMDYYREHASKAEALPTYQNTFRTLLLSQWVGQETRFIPMDQWDLQAEKPTIEDGSACFAGLDLASTTDLASFVLVFPGVDGRVLTVPTFFMPADNVRERGMRDGVPYETWVQQGLIVATPGNVIDYAYIKDTIRHAAERYDLKDVSYDRWGAIQLAQELESEGIKMVQMGQGFASMSPPTKELLRLVLEQKLVHGGNPVLRWNAENTAAKLDEAGNVKPDKAKSSARIDGLVATVMALDGLMRRGPSAMRKSVYESRGLFSWDEPKENA
jgi:phage terminase large subunit-like protein